VHETKTLREAALAHLDAAGEAFLNSDENVDVEACLIMLLDRGSLASWSIQESRAN